MHMNFWFIGRVTEKYNYLESILDCLFPQNMANYLSFTNIVMIVPRLKHSLTHEGHKLRLTVKVYEMHTCHQIEVCFCKCVCCLVH